MSQFITLCLPQEVLKPANRTVPKYWHPWMHRNWACYLFVALMFLNVFQVAGALCFCVLCALD